MADQTIRRFIRLILDRSSAQQTGQEMERALAQAGQQGGQSFLRELRAQFDRRMAELREQLARGLIDEQEFRRRADEAAREFNRGLLQNIERLRREGQLTDREFVRLTRSLKNVGDEGEKSAGRIRTAFSTVRSVIGGAVAFLAARGIGRFFADSIRIAEEAASVWDILAANVENAGVQFERVRPEIEAAARAAQQMTRYDDDSFARALSELVSITLDYAGSLRNMDVVLDLAAAKHMDLETAARLVGRAMIGQTELLRRYGITVREGADAVQAIREQFRGAAEKEGAGLAGTLQRIRNAWDDLKQAVGEVLLTGDSAGRQMNVLVDVLVRMEGWIRRNASAIQTWVDLLARAGGFVANLAADWARLIDPIGAQAGDVIATIRAQPNANDPEFLRRRLEVERREVDRLMAERERLRAETAERVRNLGRSGRDSDFLPADLARDLRRLEEIERQAEVSRRVVAFLEQEIERLAQATRPTGTGRPRGGAPDFDQEIKAFDAQIKALERGHKLGILRFADIERAYALEQRLVEQLRRGNLALEDRVALEEQLARLRRVLQIEVPLDIAGTAQAEIRGGFLQIAAEPLTEADLGIDAIAEAWLETNEQMVAAAQNAAMGIAGAFQDAFSLILQGMDNVGEAAEALGRGIAGAFLGGLAQYASTKVAENIALAFEEFAKGQAAAASIVLAPTAPLHYAAAKSHLLAAAKWSVLAGLAGAAQSAVAGGGRGGLSGGVPTGATDVGGRLIEQQQRGPEVHIYINPLDPSDPVYQRNVMAASQLARERYGEDAVVHVHRLPAAARR